MKQQIFEFNSARVLFGWVTGVVLWKRHERSQRTIKKRMRELQRQQHREVLLNYKQNDKNHNWNTKVYWVCCCSNTLQELWIQKLSGTYVFRLVETDGLPLMMNWKKYGLNYQNIIYLYQLSTRWRTWSQRKQKCVCSDRIYFESIHIKMTLWQKHADFWLVNFTQFAYSPLKSMNDLLSATKIRNFSYKMIFFTEINVTKLVCFSSKICRQISTRFEIRKVSKTFQSGAVICTSYQTSSRMGLS